MSAPVLDTSTTSKDDDPITLPKALDHDVGSIMILSDEEERKLLRKIDLNILPFLLISYMLQFLDKVTLGYAAIMGIIEDAHLHGKQYSWLSSAFYFGYLVACYPASFGFVKLPIGKYIAGAIITWGVILALHAVPNNFPGLLILRILLGVFESVISPGFSLITSMWYKPSEHVSRHVIWFAGNATSSLFAGLVGYGIAQVGGRLAPWKWLYIIYGVITFVWGLVLIWKLPDSQFNARFLKQDERKLAFERAQRVQHGDKDGKYDMVQVKEALIDPKTWLMGVFIFLSCIANAAASNFGSIITKGFGFTTLQTFLMNIPNGTWTLILLLTSTLIAGRFKRSRCFVIMGLLSLALLGILLMQYLPARLKVGRLIGNFLFSGFSAAFPFTLSLLASNTAGFTKKATVNAVFFVCYCVGNISGPYFFISSQAPRYRSGFEAIIISVCLGIGLAGAYRVYADFENKRRDRKYGVKIDPEQEDDDTHVFGIQLRENDMNRTDWEQETTFRYIL